MSSIPSIPLSEVEDDVRYRVRMVRTRKVLDVTLRRASEPILKGRVIKEIGDDAADIRPLA